LDEGKIQNGFEIRNSRISIRLSLRPIESLRPHEEIVPHELGLIVHDLERENSLRHPIIADTSSGVILDGTHRLAPLKVLECNQVPCALVEYDDPRIIVERWYRIITGSSLDEFVEELGGETQTVPTNEEAEKCLTLRECYASISDGKSWLTLPCNLTTPLELIRAAYKIEEFAKQKGFKIKYSDTNKPVLSSDRLVLSTIALNKPEIVKSALSGEVFPPKTTRHIIPSRPLATSTPLELLRSKHTREAQALFVQGLQSRQVKKMPEGSKIGSRRYMEEVFVFT